MRKSKIGTSGTARTKPKTTISTHAEDTPKDVNNIESWSVKTLNNYLAKNISFGDGELDILKKKEIDGKSFFKLTKLKLRNFGIKGGPAGRIVALSDSLKPKTFNLTFKYEKVVKIFTMTYRSLSELSLKKFQRIAQEAFKLPNREDHEIIIKYNDTILNSDEIIRYVLKAKKVITLIITPGIREFYSYKDLKEVLQIHGIDGDNMQDIPTFSPECVYPMKDNNVKYVNIINNDDSNKMNEGNEMKDNTSLNICVDEIKAILSAIGDVKSDQNDILDVLPATEYVQSNQNGISPAIESDQNGILSATEDTQYEQDEIQRSFIITAILVAAINSVSCTILRSNIIGNLNYTIKRVYLQSITEEIVCVTEVKKNNVREGIAQNIMQIRSSFKMNDQKCNLDELSQDYSNYTYGIVTNATEWYFLKYTPDQIYCSHPIVISLQIDNNEKLKESIKMVLGRIIWMLEDRNRIRNVTCHE